MNIKSIVKAAAVMIITAASIPVLTGCGSSAALDLDDLYNANTTASILELHGSVYEEYEYHENLDDEVTFTTSYCYAEQEDGSAIYEAKGNDAADPGSDDNFSYCIVGNIEYMKDSKGRISVYPLTADYIDSFRSRSFTVNISEAERLESAKYSGHSVIFTTLSDAAGFYSEEALTSINALCSEPVEKIRIIYTAEKASLLLTNEKILYVGKSGNEYLFCEENLTYDEASLDLSYAKEYITPESTRTITVIEKPDGRSDVSDVFTIGSDIIPDFECFRTFSGYTIYNDPDGLDPYDTETPDAQGRYPSITLYARPTPAAQPALTADQPSADAQASGTDTAASPEGQASDEVTGTDTSEDPQTASSNGQ